MSDYLDNAQEAQWIKPAVEQEFDTWEPWTWMFINTPW